MKKLVLAVSLLLTFAQAPAIAMACALDLLAAAVQTQPVAEDKDLGAKLWEPLPGVLFLEFDTQTALTKTFLRMQEHFESPRFRGEVFTINEFVRWYSEAQGKGHFTYFTDWAGFNFPSRNLARFYDGSFNPLTVREQRLLNLIAPYRARPFYLVAGFREGDKTQGPRLSTLRHEVAHALFFLDDAYRAEVLAILSTVDTSAIGAYLKRIGYCDAVLEDETNAYLTNDAAHLERKGIDIPKLLPVMAKLDEAFERAFARRVP